MKMKKTGSINSTGIHYYNYDISKLLPPVITTLATKRKTIGFKPNRLFISVIPEAMERASVNYFFISSIQAPLLCKIQV